MVAAIVMVLVAVVPTIAQEPVSLDVTSHTKILRCGDFEASSRWTLNPEQFRKMKEAFPDPQIMWRDLMGRKALSEVRDVEVKWDDASHSMLVSFIQVGGSYCADGLWFAGMGPNLVVESISDERVVLVNDDTEASETATYSMRREVELPPGAYDAQFSSQEGYLIYKMDHERVTGDATVRCQLTNKTRLMSAMYKIYASPEINNGMYWVGKATLYNAGDTPVYDVRISFNMVGYDDWGVPSVADVLLPKGSLCAAYFPILPARLAELRSQTPAEVRCKFEYVDSNGEAHEELRRGRLKLLGINQFDFSSLLPEESMDTFQDNFSNVPLLASFVTKNDIPVRRFADGERISFRRCRRRVQQ
jgi:hypothetical protein